MGVNGLVKAFLHAWKDHLKSNGFFLKSSVQSSVDNYGYDCICFLGAQGSFHGAPLPTVSTQQVQPNEVDSAKTG